MLLLARSNELMAGFVCSIVRNRRALIVKLPFQAVFYPPFTRAINRISTLIKHDNLLAFWREFMSCYRFIKAVKFKGASAAFVFVFFFVKSGKMILHTSPSISMLITLFGGFDSKISWFFKKANIQNSSSCCDTPRPQRLYPRNTPVVSSFILFYIERSIIAFFEF